MPAAAMNDERSLLAMVALGNRHAFTQLYTTYLDSLYDYVFLFTKSKEETDEILQEIFVKIWENRRKLPEIGSLRHYLFRIARNRVLDKIRHLHVRQRALSEIERSGSIAETTTSDHFFYKEYYQLVQQAIEKLPPKRRLIFRLITESGLSQDEIAVQLNISKSVVQKQIYAASHFVRKYLFDHGEISFSVLLAFCISF